MHNYIIETERLILRPLKIEDAKAVYQWVSDERVARYMVYNTYTSVEAVVEWLSMRQQPDEEYHFGFVRKEDGLLIGSGSIGPDSNRNGFWKFGYNFRYDCWGNGYATEATKAMIKFANEHFGITKFSSSHVEQNKASGHVMEKCGLHFVKYGQFEKLDGSNKMRSMEYEGEISIF
ncbi:MAG: GNAT family N-acetyltransferase [Lachnospiraceae bacterium]|nr:GNAT family N-acetyltransferase [Lachnospiraceae bacterium]